MHGGERCGAKSRVERIDPGSDPRWDALARGHVHAGAAHLPGWAAMLGRFLGRARPVYLGLTNGNGGGLEAGLALMHVRSPLTGSRLVGLPFATVADPLATVRPQLDSLLRGAREEAERVGADRVELRCAGAAELALKCGMAETRRFKVHVLRLDREPELLLKSFDRSCVRQQIAKSLKSGLRFAPGDGEADFGDFYRLYVQTRKRLRLPPLPPELFSALLGGLGPDGNAEILLARSGDAVVGGLLTLRHGRRTSFEHVGVDPDFKGPSVFHFLYWNGILRAIEAGSGEVDFGRTAESNTGLMNFKKRWNTTVSDLVHCEAPAGDGARPRSSRKEITGDSLRYRLLQKACELSSEEMLVRLGRLCYRHYV